MSLDRSQLYELLLDALRNLYDAGKLSKSELAKSRQVETFLNQNPASTPTVAMREILEETVKFLPPEEADLLKARFWERLRVDDMADNERFGSLGSRTILDRQRRYIHRLADWFWEKEEQLEKLSQTQPAQSDTPYTSTAFQEASTQFSFKRREAIDFSQFAIGQLPVGLKFYGDAPDDEPTIKELEGGIKGLHFPEIRWKQIDLNVLLDEHSFAPPYQVTAKFRFNSEQVDRAGLMIAWQNRSNLIRIQSNIYWNHLDLWEFIDGHLNNRIKAPINGIIEKQEWYWLKVLVQPVDELQNLITTYWSIDNITFTPLLRIVTPSRLIGKVGFSTSGPNLPDVDVSEILIEY